MDRGTVHPPPPRPETFSSTAQREEEGSEGRNETEDDIAQEDSGDTHQDDPLAPDRSEKYLQMKDAVWVLREEIEDL